MNHYQTPTSAIRIGEPSKGKFWKVLLIFELILLVVCIDVIVENNIDFEYMSSTFHRVNDAMNSAIMAALGAVVGGISIVLFVVAPHVRRKKRGVRINGIREKSSGLLFFDTRG